MTVATSSLMDRLAELHDTVAAAEQRLADAEADLRTRSRRADRLQAELAEYAEQVGAGEREPDAALERKLRGRLQDAAATSRTEPIIDGGRVIALRFIDVEGEARVTGARRARDKAVAEHAAFLQAHLPELAVERHPGDHAAADQLARALEALATAEAAWDARRRFWGHALTLAGRPDLAGELPDSPTRGMAPAVQRHAPLPIPAALTPDTEETPDE